MSDTERENLNKNRLANSERRIIAKRNDTGCDFYLPDYMGDIKRIIHYSAAVLPAGQYVNEDEISLSGVVAYSVIYLDGENRLQEATFTSDFELTCATHENFVNATSKSEISSLAVRAAGARKISAKASVSTDVYILEEFAVPPIDFGIPLEMKTRNIKIHAPEYLETKEMEYAERGRLLCGIGAEEVETVMSFGKARVTDTKCEGDKIKLCCEMNVGCLVRALGEEYIRIDKLIPTEVYLDCENLRDSCDISAEARLTSISVSVTNDVNEDGEAGASVVFNTVCEYTARLDANDEYEVITDAFAAGRRCEYTYKELEFDEHLYTVASRHREDLKLKCDKNGDAAPNEVLYSDVKARQTSMKLEGTDALVEGELFVTLICLNENGAGYTTLKETYPFSIKQRIDVHSGADLECRIDVGELEINVSDKIEMSAEICLTVTARKKCKLSVLCEVKEKPAERDSSSQSCFVAYYPKEKDTLWEVAKRYGVSVNEIAIANDLNVATLADRSNENLLSGVKMLLIKPN